MKQHDELSESEPFTVLGLEQTATEAEIRRSYLELVKQYPPESNPVKFGEIRKAYESASNPLILAQRLLVPSSRMPQWEEVIQQQVQDPPMLSASLLLALGNRPVENSKARIEKSDVPND